MITFLAFSASLVAFSLTLMQIVYVCLFIKFLRRSSEAEVERKQYSTEGLPPAAVVLCLRGLDPSLRLALKGLADQKYPTFEVHIMVDSMDDAAVQFVRDHSPDHLNFQIHEFPDKLSTCSLKCSALIHAVQSNSSSMEFLAFLDADTVPDPNWLRDLIVPLLAEDVGATTGNRWYWPTEWTPGSAVRQVWNSAAIVQLTIYGIAWGGSFAIKRKVLTETEILKRWSESFCEDTLISVELKKKNLKLLHVPDLVCLNSETVSLGSAYRWIARQLLTVRLYHPLWPLIQLHGLSTFIASVLASILAIICLFSGAISEFVILVVVICVYQVTNMVLLHLIDSRAFEIACNRSIISKEVRGWDRINRFYAMFINQMIYPMAVWNAMRCQRVRWRGIDYSVEKGKHLRMEKYVPYRSGVSSPIDCGDCVDNRNSIE